MTTQAHHFFSDPKVVEAKQTLLNALTEHQNHLTGIKPANSELAADYLKTVEEFSENRGGKLYFNYLASGIGNGALVELGDGSVKYDLISGIGVHHFGHSHPQIIEACLDAALSDTVMQGNLQQNPASAKFVKTLLGAANRNGGQFKHCFLTSTGVMAGENAFKIAYQKNAPADRAFVFERCFMGRTLALSQFTDKAAYRVGLPVNYHVDTVPFFDEKDPKGSTERALATIRKQMAKYPGQYAAMAFELILGEGGFYPGQKEFYRTIMQELRDHGVAILVDEVQSFARTSELFAFQYFGLDDLVDIVWIGKASQACATLYRADFKPKPGLLSQTYTASTTAIAAGQVILDALLNDGYLGADGKIAELETAFHSRLAALQEKHPGLIEGPFGVGGMVAFTPFGGDKDKVVQFVKELFDAGVMSFMAGANPMRARFLIPVGALKLEDLDPIFEVVEQTLVKLG